MANANNHAADAMAYGMAAKYPTQNTWMGSPSLAQLHDYLCVIEGLDQTAANTVVQNVYDNHNNEIDRQQAVDSIIKHFKGMNMQASVAGYPAQPLGMPHHPPTSPPVAKPAKLMHPQAHKNAEDLLISRLTFRHRFCDPTKPMQDGMLIEGVVPAFLTVRMTFDTAHVIFMVHDNHDKPVCLEDPADNFPSDGLITAIRLAMETSK